jgi:CRISPR-associated endonuclease/helicase Cas3
VEFADFTYIWAKKSRDSYKYLPLIEHLRDTLTAALYLWRKTLPEGTRCFLQKETNNQAEEIIAFLALVHDIGKISPAFQNKKSHYNDLDEFIKEGLFAAGLSYGEMTEAAIRACPHNLVGQALLEEYGIHSSISCIVGGHHGMYGDSPRSNTYSVAFGKSDEWKSAQRFIFDYAISLSKFDINTHIPKTAQVILTGLLITADWLASSEKNFPLISPGEYNIDREKRDFYGIECISNVFPDIIPDWNGFRGEALYNDYFGFEPREFQKLATKTAKGIKSPGIFIIEAPMGCGKTEAALVATEIFADKTDRGGFYFALPTQATSNGIFKRILNFLNKLNSGGSFQLCHGKAQFNDDNRELYRVRGNDVFYDNDENSVFADTWFDGRKRSLLADFAVGTVDRILMVSLKQKHVMLGHLGLSKKVVIIDECHAYDAYMSEYLKQTLYFLGKYGVPVIILSATLPANKRAELISAYTRRPFFTENTAYPLITYTDGESVYESQFDEANNQKTIAVSRYETAEITELLSEKLSNGGAAAVIVNTVGRAQEISEKLRERFGNKVFLLHSRFIDTDRIKREKFLLEKIGKDAKLTPGETFIVVGTQVIEQSLDIDFDFMITDICPADLLLQRIGRLHRHNRNRPELLQNPECIVLTDSEAFKKSGFIYADYLLKKTDMVLDDSIVIPRDIPVLVNDVYSGGEDFAEEREAWEKAIAEKKKNSHDFMLGEIEESRISALNNLKRWMNFNQSDSDTAGESSVRDGGMSIEIILLIKKNDGYYTASGTFISGLNGGMPTAEMCKLTARESLRLPQSLSYTKTIKELEILTLSEFKTWLQSPWLTGQLILAIPPDGFKLSGYKINYNNETGFTYARIQPD